MSVVGHGVSAPPRRQVDLFFWMALFLQIAMAILLGCFTTYGPDTHPSGQSDVSRHMNFYVDVATMIWIGFGFLMVFARKLGYTSVVFTFIISAFVVQWALLCIGFAKTVYNASWNSRIVLNMDNLIDAVFCAGSVMITFGAFIGKVSPVQLLFIAFFDVMIYAINFIILYSYLKVADIGGSMVIHLFGAYFGLTISGIVSPRGEDAHRRYAKGLESTYTSDLFSMIGTIFLWINWPSFNGALAHQGYQLMAVINTLISLCACAFTTSILSRLMRGDNKMHMVDMQNATLAGGVAMGCMADTPISPGVAVAVGMVAALVSTFGFNFLMPRLERLGLHDACGVHNLHGMPGLLGGLVGVIATSEYFTQGSYGSAYTSVFANGSRQAKIQMAGIGVTIGFALAGGALVGFLTRLLFRPLRVNEMMTDATYFHLPSDFVDYSDDEHARTSAAPADVALKTLSGDGSEAAAPAPVAVTAGATVPMGAVDAAVGEGPVRADGPPVALREVVVDERETQGSSATPVRLPSSASIDSQSQALVKKDA